MIIPFRPSSHSTDLTIVAVFSNEEAANKKFKKFKCEDTRVTKYQNKIIVNMLHGSLSKAEKIQRRLSKLNPTQIIVYDDYQEATIEFPIPPNTPREHLPLLLSPAELAIYRKVKLKGKLLKHKNKTIIKYKGEKIYFHYTDPLTQKKVEYFIINGKNIPCPKTVKVKVHIQT